MIFAAYILFESWLMVQSPGSSEHFADRDRLIVLYHTILYYTILYCTPDFTRLVYVPRNSTLGPYSLPALVKPKVHLFHVFRPLYYSHKGPCSLP